MTRDAEAVIEMLIVAARQNIRVKSIKLATPSYLRVALGANVRQEDADMRWARPDAAPAAYAPMNAAYQKPVRYESVQVGKSFKLHGPMGEVLIEEDAS